MNKQDIFQIIVNHVREILPELEQHEFQQDEQLVNLGANSIDRAEIVAMTMESLSLNIPRVELAAAKNIGELAEIVYEKYTSN
ncbi:acyl carrier protein [Bacillus thuringiensis]|uniref:acyl carrier protein n=1 Tax=Bacillus thuringiensis TaxID=1428 RepID=UPI000CD9C5DB|nr:acyl carrier protein [Bacillus thuringiensis]QFQ28658.1 acyl carrier protein [Bacillus thuringiensis]